MKTVEVKRREANQRQSAYDLRIDERFTSMQTADSRKKFLDSMKPMQRQRLEQKFHDVLNPAPVVETAKEKGEKKEAGTKRTGFQRRKPQH